MRTTKRWGFVNSAAQEYMLNRAERHRKELERECKANERRLPRAVKANKR